MTREMSMTSKYNIPKELVEIIGEENIHEKLTELNYPEIILRIEEICLDISKYNKLKELGYDFDVGCVACCGYGYLEKHIDEERGKICFKVIPCFCHPYNYFLVLKPTKR